MMEINRSNYEIWLIDWIDGNLNETGVAKLMDFLSENPDLKEEADDLRYITIKPPERYFLNKQKLLKSTSDISQHEFELLAAGYLENDLNDAQKAAVNLAIRDDEEKKNVFGLIQRTKLFPDAVSFPHKDRLYKKTTARKIIRMSLIGLSAAAFFTLAVAIYFLTPHQLQPLNVKTVQNITNDSILNSPHLKRSEEPVDSVQQISRTGKIPVAKLSNGVPVSRSPVLSDSSEILTRHSQVLISKITVKEEIELYSGTIENSLIPNTQHVNLVSDDGRSKFRKLIARAFREKLLKEKAPEDTPLKAFEIAKAGITGLNKLLGWEMALEQRNDTTGRVRSVYFSSKILKFNAPVKQ